MSLKITTKKKEKFVIQSYTISESQQKKLAVYAKKTGVNKSFVIQQLIEQNL